MEESPSKLSVAELAGRFKGQIRPMPAAHDELPFRRKAPCSLRFPIRDNEESNTNTNGTVPSPIKIRTKSSSSIIERLQANLALSPSTLLPSPKVAEVNRQPDSLPLVAAATTPLSPTLLPTQLSVEEDEEGQGEPVGFDSPPEATSLPNLHKTRVRLSFKRRPPTRQHRRSTGEEATLLGRIPSPCQLHSPEANGDVVLQCPDRVTREGGDGEEEEEDRDCEEEQGERAEPPAEEGETQEGKGRPQQTDGADADAVL
ncbi:capZ-interacting protein-like [Syngnathus typhle]|uniref:capZ-interacting protein-like n=1 Tax=Syngnathus typhle TaxID=161592 RepID=UPI002A6A275A|nr:capZ-interacting protein-like [Syngnathus typhle]XP_061137227.1 capZ-interacting protein-like [Syngnathus typhle]